jgi:hypothetical protein
MQNTRRIFASIGCALQLGISAFLIWIPLSFAATAVAFTQTPAQEAGQGNEGPGVTGIRVVPQQVRYAGKLANRAGDTVEAAFSIYAAAEGGDPIWTETQRVTVSEGGSYSVLLGGASSSGLPQTLFAGGAARWLGVSVERGPEQERVLLSSVPYAMKSADAESLAGHAASDFVTQKQLAQLAELAQSSAQSGQQGVAAPQVQPNTSGTVTGSGTTGTIPLWTGALTEGNSEITQVGSDVGINMAKPGATLDVGGSENVEGVLTLPAQATATTSAGYRSQLLDFSDSSWSTTTKAPVAQTWRLYAAEAGNNTANPTSSFNLQFQNGAGAAAPTILSIGETGVISFAPTQTFPGTIASVAATSPVTATTTSGAVSLGLNQSALVTDIAPAMATAITPTLEGTFNGLYAQLATSNTFNSYLEANQSGGNGTAALLGFGDNGSIGVYGHSDKGYGVEGISGSGAGVFGEAANASEASIGVLGSTGTSFSNTFSSPDIVAFFSAGVWADTSGTGTGIPVGLVATADDSLAAYIANSSGTNAALFVDNKSGIGVASLDGTASVGTAGIIGIDGNAQSFLASDISLSAGVWGDSPGTRSASFYSPGILGTADDNYAGAFFNESSAPTIFAKNYESGGTGLFKTLMAVSNEGTCGFGGKGDLSCTGQVKSLVSTGGGARTVETYAMQSPENWMEDFGSAELQQGVAVVKIDAAFAETVAEDPSYHVFITPNGDSKGLYVIKKTAASFEVRESGGGTSSLAFDYRIVARRRGYEAQRLVDVTDRFKAETARAAQPRVIGTPREPGRRVPMLRTPQGTGTPRVPGKTHPTAEPARLQKTLTAQP